MRAVPWITQYASPELIAAIAYQEHPRTDDPRWAESGAPDLAAYGFWCSRWCGMACLRMALIARDGAAPTLYELVTGCEEYGGYVREADGSVTGLVYQPFAEYVRDKHGLRADVITHLDSARLAAELDAGRLVMASVTPEIRRPGQPPRLQGGHLVLVTGHACEAVTFHNPSGHTPEAGVATLPVGTFDRFAAGRGVALHVLPQLTGQGRDGTGPFGYKAGGTMRGWTASGSTPSTGTSGTRRPSMSGRQSRTSSSRLS